VAPPIVDSIIVVIKTDQEELYDLTADPCELRNLATAVEHSAVKQTMKYGLLEWALRETVNR
jgi:hypothetical protein